MGMKTAGSRLPTRTLNRPNMLIAMPTISSPPTADISVTTASVRNGATYCASSAIAPW